MPMAPTRSSTASAVLLSDDRAAIRRFALRRAAISALLTVVLTWQTGMFSVVFGLFFGAATYIGFAARDTRGLFRADEDPRSRI